jgi:hypothetical protein
MLLATTRIPLVYHHKLVSPLIDTDADTNTDADTDTDAVFVRFRRHHENYNYQYHEIPSLRQIPLPLGTNEILPLRVSPTYPKMR